MDADRGFLYGVVALQAGLVESRHYNDLMQMAEECDEGSDGPFPDLLVKRGLLRPTDRAHLEYLVTRKLQTHCGDATVSLASLREDVKCSLRALGEVNVQQRWSGVHGPENLSVAPTGAEPQQRYTLSGLHATGGIGRVWMAHDSQMGRDVALKELLPEQAENAVLCARFLREAQITGQLEHPGIVPVYELARRTDTGRPFYTMRFVKGRTLCEAARAFHEKRAAGEVNMLEFSGLLTAFVTVCKTVAYANTRGVIHRDLKGANVIVGDFGEVVVLDWGLAKLMAGSAEDSQSGAVSLGRQAVAHPDLTMQGDTLGTPSYMAPEQAASNAHLIDCRTDVYGLGAILYQLLTGRPPFAAADVAEVLWKVRFERPAAPREVWAEVPPPLESACLRALEKQPVARFASANDLAQELEQWQEVQRKQAVEALRASEALYHALVESIPIYVWRKDEEGRFTFANKWLCDALGTTPENIVGLTDFDLFSKELAEKYRRDDAHVRDTGQRLQVTEEGVSAKGLRGVVNVIKIPIQDAKGKIVGTQGMGISWDANTLKDQAGSLLPLQGG